MAHRTSAAALHAARVLLDNYTFEVIPPEQLVSGAVPNMQANETCIGIVIDILSNVYHLSELRPELRYWQHRIFAGTATAPQIANFLNKCVEMYERVPRDEEPTLIDLPTPDSFGNEPIMPPRKWGKKRSQVLTRASKEATRGLLHYFRIYPKRGPAHPDLVVSNLTKLLDVSLGLSRAEEGRPLVGFWKKELIAGRATDTDIKKCLRQLGIILESLPNYENREEEVKLLS